MEFYIALSVVVLAAIFILTKKQKRKRLTPLAGVAFAFIIAGIIFEGLIGYGLMGIGLILAAIDIWKKRK